MASEILPTPNGDDHSGNHLSGELAQFQRVEGEYGADQLEHLSDLEHVRERPSMYIADTGVRGLHHLVYEVVDNSIDEATRPCHRHLRDDQQRWVGHRGRQRAGSVEVHPDSASPRCKA